jgi:hypothetical protein
MIHVWHVFTGLVPESDEAIAQVAGFLEGHVAH